MQKWKSLFRKVRAEMVDISNYLLQETETDPDVTGHRYSDPSQSEAKKGKTVSSPSV